MLKFLVIVVGIFLGVIYFGNYIDYRNNKISRNEYDKRIKLFIILVIIIILIALWLRKRY